MNERVPSPGHATPRKPTGPDDGRRDLRTHLAGLLLALACATALFTSAPGQRAELALLDLEFRLLRELAPVPSGDRIRVVGIDEATYAAWQEPAVLWHRHLGDFLQAMAIARPAVTGFDLVLPERSYDFLVPGLDRHFMAGLLAMRKAGVPLVIGQTVDAGGRLRPIYRRFTLLAGGDDHVGLVLFQRDADGVTRRFSEALGTGDAQLPTLAGQMARHLGALPEAGLIQFAAGDDYDYISLHQVVDWYRSGDSGRLETEFAGKAVLLGPVLPWEDRHPQPVNLASWSPDLADAPGVLLHAQALRSMLGPGLIGSAPPAWSWAGVLLAACMWFAAARPVTGLALLILLAAGAVAVATLLLARGMHFAVIPAVGAASVACLSRIGLEALLRIRERRRLRSSFGAYVSPQVMREILEGNIRPGPGGERREICVLFSDIRGFTSLSEHLPAERVTGFLNRYFEEMTAAIHDCEGTIDKFMGDGIMAFFGAPGEHSEHPAQLAFRAAGDMIRRLEVLNREFTADGFDTLHIGIGLHLGDAVVGHVGSHDRHEYTAIGDVVNVASRIEGLTKNFPYPVLCSNPVREALAERDALQPVGSQALKGRSAMELFGWAAAGTN